MKSIRITQAVLSVLVLLGACASPIQPKPVTGQLAKTQQFKGIFEITPPHGENWYEIQRTNKGLLAYGKKFESSSNTFIATAHVTDRDRSFTDADEFLAFVKKVRKKDNDPSRYSMLINEESVDNTKASFCTKFHLKAEDKVASSRSGALSILESKGYTCLHPSKPNIITVEYSERGTDPFKNTAAIAEGEAFINSLVLN
jgi:hypothetical protein